MSQDCITFTLKVSIFLITLVLLKSMMKMEIGLGRGKKLYDKREDIAKKDQRREVEKQFKLSKMY